jgi:hypothetical protein
LKNLNGKGRSDSVLRRLIPEYPAARFSARYFSAEGMVTMVNGAGVSAALTEAGAGAPR